MLFESDKVSYRVSEIFEKFKDELPKIVMVAQGFYGEIVADTFDREQVIRIHTYSRQRRVVAVTLEETNQKLGHYSIPVDYRLKFCVKKGSARKGNKSFTLSEIIERNKLPVEVQFANEENVTVGSRSINTSRFPALRLTHTFEEIYLLGNFINSGVMDPRYVPIPLYLKDLRLSLITGIKGRSRDHWKSFQDELTSIANTALRYDLNYGKEVVYRPCVCTRYLDKKRYILDYSCQHTNSVVPIMMFESEDLSYRVSEFFEKFKNEFPKMVTVTQGFYGENVTDTFDRDQVIRIHTYSSQRRVVAVTLEETDRKFGHYSIPMDYPLKFCIKKGSKLKGNKEFSLGEIIAKNKLPVEVQFAKNEKVTLGLKSCSTSNFPVLRLTHTFDEVYMLGNFINNGIMDPRYVPIPLYIKDLLLSLVKGIKGRTAKHWKSFQDELTSIANTALKYDLNYGREGIAVYANPMTEDTIYEKLQPDLYAEPYDFLRYQMDEMKSSGLGKDKSIQSSSVEKVTEELKHKLKPSTQNRSPVSDISKRSPDDISVPNNSPPAIPPRNPKRNVVQVVTQSQRLLSTSTREVTATHSDAALPKDIEQYSIKDVSKALKLLRLEKYIPSFAEMVIDGRMLRTLDETILKNELHFTTIEALRLMDFVRNGHVSK